MIFATVRQRPRGRIGSSGYRRATGTVPNAQRPRLRLRARLPRSLQGKRCGCLEVSRTAMKEKKAPSVGGIKPLQSGADLEVQAHLGRKLRELFEAPFSPLPQRLTELLEALPAKDNEHPAVSASLKDALLAMIPNLRAFAVSLCGNQERADDLVQETLLKAWSHIDSFQVGTNLRAWLFTILRNTYFSEIRRRRREVEDAGGKKAESLSV